MTAGPVPPLSPWLSDEQRGRVEFVDQALFVVDGCRRVRFLPEAWQWHVEGLEGPGLFDERDSAIGAALAVQSGAKL